MACFLSLSLLPGHISTIGWFKRYWNITVYGVGLVGSQRYSCCCCCCFLGTHRWTWTFRVMSNWRFEWPKPSLARCRTLQIATFSFLSFLLIRAAGHSVQAVAPLLILSDLKPLNWWDTFTYERMFIHSSKKYPEGRPPLVFLHFSVFRRCRPPAKLFGSSFFVFFSYKEKQKLFRNSKMPEA